MRTVLFFIIVLGIISLTLFRGDIFKQEGLNSLGNSEVVISINSISTDKAVYHSSELINLDLKIYSKTDFKNAIVEVEGINGRFNRERILNLKEGINKISFSYKLPRCNVCGGIRVGNYSLNCKVSYQDIIAEDSVTIDVQQ